MDSETEPLLPKTPPFQTVSAKQTALLSLKEYCEGNNKIGKMIVFPEPVFGFWLA
jgi:hypothetical protein